MQKGKRSKPHYPSHSLTFLPLGGIEDVTKNMYLYMFGDEILIVDCGIGFADETILGVDLLIPDISYLIDVTRSPLRHPELDSGSDVEIPKPAQSEARHRRQVLNDRSKGKKIVGMLLSHGHEDHIGALPFILPQLVEERGKPLSFPIYASPFTAALANEKLKEFKIPQRVSTVQFTKPTVKVGSFIATFIRVTHSVPDSANIFIKTPAGNFYHGSDFKLDLTPADGKKTEYLKITKAQTEGVLGLMSDSLGAERVGFTPSELSLEKNFETAMRDVEGKVIITTYSSHIARINQGIQAAKRLGRKICFVGRSIVKAVQVAKTLGYMNIPEGMEIKIDQIKKYDDSDLLLFIAGSQGQENSSLSRVAGDEHREIKLTSSDLVIFSADTIPGNEISVRALLDDISKKGTKVLYSEVSDDFHVSGHGSTGDLQLMMSLVGAKYVMPISTPYTTMIAYRELAKNFGYKDHEIILPENGREIHFSKKEVKKGKKHDIRNVYVDEISGEEVEGYVLRDREKLAKEGVIIVMAEVNAQSGKLAGKPDVIARGFSAKDVEELNKTLEGEIRNHLKSVKSRSKNSMHLRRQLDDVIIRYVSKTMQRKPLVLPIVIEV